jgi:hypothetical protein
VSDPTDSNLNQLPTWPAEAQDIPDKITSSSSMTTSKSGAILGAGIGLLFGMVTFFANQKLTAYDMGVTLGAMLMLGLFGAGIGRMIDRREKRDDQFYDR